MIEVEEHPEAPSARAARVARTIMDEMPRSRPELIRADVLALLVLLDPAPRTVVAIAVALYLPAGRSSARAPRSMSATATELVDRAEAHGLVRRHTRGAASDDRREVIVVLTAKGKRVRARRRGAR